jgi:transposase-like protein
MAEPSSPSFSDSSLSSVPSAAARRLTVTGVPDAHSARDAQGHFTQPFRVAAVRYALTCGKSLKAAARDMGLSDKTLGGWVRDAAPDSAGIVDVQRFDELAQLRKDNRELLARNSRLTAERDFLKKCASCFATPTNSAKGGSK